MERILVINLGWEQRPLIRALAARPKCILFGVHNGKDFHDDLLFEKVIKCDYFDVSLILEFAQDNKVNAVISDQCDFSLFTQSVVAAALNLPGPSLEAAYLSNNKYLQRQKSKDKGILIPEFELCLSPQQMISFANRTGYPVIVKPVDNRGSIGVFKVTQENEVESAFFQAISNSRSQSVLVEEFIHGKQFTVDGYSFTDIGCKTLAIGEKIMISEDVQVAMGISYPANITDFNYKRLAILNEEVNKKLGYKWGMLHSEYMYRDGEFYLIESSNRGGGCFTSEIVVPAVTDYNLVEQYINSCLDTSICSKRLFNLSKNQITLRFFELKVGLFKEVTNWQNISNSSNCLAAKLNLTSGEEIHAISSDANRHGFLIVKGTNIVAENMINSMRVSYD